MYKNLDYHLKLREVKSLKCLLNRIITSLAVYMYNRSIEGNQSATVTNRQLRFKM